MAFQCRPARIADKAIATSSLSCNSIKYNFNNETMSSLNSKFEFVASIPLLFNLALKNLLREFYIFWSHNFENEREKLNKFAKKKKNGNDSRKKKQRTRRREEKGEDDEGRKEDAFKGRWKEINKKRFSGRGLSSLILNPSSFLLFINPFSGSFLFFCFLSFILSFSRRITNSRLNSSASFNIKELKSFD